MTAFLVLIIIVTGVGVTQGKKDWWIAGLALMGIFLAVFVVLNAILLVKIAISLLALIFTLNFIFELGTNADPNSSTGLIWVLAQVFLYFFIMSLSYLIPGTRSRWTISAVTMLVSLLMGATLVDSIPPKWAILTSVTISVIFFITAYRLWGQIRSVGEMPLNRASEGVYQQLTRVADDSGWEIRRLIRRSFWGDKSTVEYLVWKERAYLLYPVALKSKFTVDQTRRGVKLLYRNHSINTWLLLLINHSLPLWRTRNAPMTMVLMDILNTNGKKAEAIGVSTPDTARKLAVGVYPSSNISKRYLDEIDNTYSQYSALLSPKHQSAMAKIGISRKKEIPMGPHLQVL